MPGGMARISNDAAGTRAQRTRAGQRRTLHQGIGTNAPRLKQLVTTGCEAAKYVTTATSAALASVVISTS